jgi:GNAT superfamily N-acetyltransferase
MMLTTSTYEVHKDNFTISTNPTKLDIPFIHSFLSTQSTWAKGIPVSTVERSIHHSLCFGVYQGQTQIGFARIISDFATITYLGDVFIIDSHRGLGLSKWLMEVVLSHPDLQGMRRWMLVTADAHGLYEKFGFKKLAKPESYMELHNPGVYSTSA